MSPDASSSGQTNKYNLIQIRTWSVACPQTPPFQYEIRLLKTTTSSREWIKTVCGIIWSGKIRSGQSDQFLTKGKRKWTIFFSPHTYMWNYYWYLWRKNGTKSIKKVCQFLLKGEVTLAQRVLTMWRIGVRQLSPLHSLAASILSVNKRTSALQTLWHPSVLADIVRKHFTEASQYSTRVIGHRRIPTLDDYVSNSTTVG